MSRYVLSPSCRQRSILAVCVAAFSALLVVPTAFAHEGWVTDMEQAIAEAKKEGKDIFVDFSGSDWCHWCQVLDKEVLSKDAFAAAKDKFVLVSLDFPKGTEQSDEQKKHNELWRKKFEVAGFPMVFLLDDSGRPYARTGYQKGGVEKYLTHLDELQEIRVKRDAAFAMAESAQGVERAKHLDVAIQTMEPGIAWLGYEPTIQEIEKLDTDDAAGLKTKYGQGLQRRLIGKELQTIMGDFEPSKAAVTVEALRALDAKIAPTGKVRDDLLGMIARILLESGKTDEALKMADDRLSEDESIGGVSQLNWIALKVNALVSTEDFDGALKTLDTLAGSGSLQGNRAVAVSGLRAQVLVSAGREAEAVKVLDALLPELEDGRAKSQLMQMRDAVSKRAESKAAKESAPAK